MESLSTTVLSFERQSVGTTEFKQIRAYSMYFSRLVVNKNWIYLPLKYNKSK